MTYNVFSGTLNPTHSLGDEIGFVGLIHEAEYVKWRSCRSHWTEAGCLTSIVEQYHDLYETLKYTAWTGYNDYDFPNLKH